MKVAIVGAGLSGMAVGWHLLHTLNPSLTFFDPNGIGGGTSGIAAGLMHTYAGLHCKLNLNGMEGYQATYKLLQICAENSSDSVFLRSGLIRIALNEKNLYDYTKCAASYADVKLLTDKEVMTLAPGAVEKSGIYIESALTVYTDSYLKTLWKFFFKKGAHLETTAIKTLEELKEFDLMVVTNGAAATNIKELTFLPINPIKGQLLELEWPDDLPILTAPLNTQAYIVMNPNGRSCIVGATYERNYKDHQPDLQTAIEDIMPKAISMIPMLKEAKILGCRAGIRASTPGHLPYLKNINPKCWVLIGMGSKGLLYHAYYAEKLVEEIALSL